MRNSIGARATSHEPRATSFGRGLLVAGCLSAAGVLAYSNSFSVPFILDDATFITENPAVRRLWAPWGIVPMRPVLGFSLALNYALSGENPWSYHAANLAIHVLAALLLFGVVRRTLGGERLRPRFGRDAGLLALATAALWLVHPLQTQAVTYVIQRGESLMGLFCLLTLYCAIRAHESLGARAWWWAAAGASAALSLGAKQVAAVSLPLVVLYYWVFFPDSLRGFLRRRSAGFQPAPCRQDACATRWLWPAVGLLAAAWLALCVVLIRTASHQTAGFGIEGFTPASYALTQCGVVLHYLRLAVWPDALCLDYGWPLAARLADVWPSVATVGALVLLTAWGVIARYAPAYPAAWFFIALAPTSSFIPIADVVEEHRMYLPLAGVIALVVVGGHCAVRRLAARGSWLTARNKPDEETARTQFANRFAVPSPQPPVPSPQSLLFAVLCVLVAAGLGLLTWRRNADYRSEFNIWQDTVLKRPRNPRGHNNLSALLTRAGRAAEGEAEARLALALKPDYEDAQNNLGYALLESGHADAALAPLREALKLNPAMALAHANMGIALGRLGQYAEAEAHLRKAVALKPGYAEGWCNLGVALQLAGRTEAAVQCYREALRLKPNYAKAHGSLGNALAALGRGREALTELQEAVRLQPDYLEAHYALGVAAFKAGELELARTHLRRVLELRPELTAAREELDQVETALAARDLISPQRRRER